MSFFSSKLILASVCGSCLQQLCGFVTVIFLCPHFFHMCWNPSVKKSFLLPHLLMRSFIYISMDLYLFYSLGYNLISSLFILLLLGSLSDYPCGQVGHFGMSHFYLFISFNTSFLQAHVVFSLHSPGISHFSQNLGSFH